VEAKAVPDQLAPLEVTAGDSSATVVAVGAMEHTTVRGIRAAQAQVDILGEALTLLEMQLDL
jgi:hypothetical protein